MRLGHGFLPGADTRHINRGRKGQALTWINQDAGPLYVSWIARATPPLLGSSN